MLAKILKTILEEKEMSITELSKRTGVAKSNLVAWSAGSNPRIDQLAKVADFLGVSIDYLVTGKKEKELDLDSILEKINVHTALYELTIKKVSKK